MGIFYHLFLYLFNLLLLIIFPFNQRARLWIKGRKEIFSQVAAKLKDGEHRIWIHAASLGEFEQGRPVIEAIKRISPDYKIVLTFFSPSGYEIRKDYEHADYVFYLPLDTKRNAEKFTELIHPDLVIFIKYEFWHNFLTRLKKLQIPTYIVSAIFRKEQVFFKWYGKWYREILNSFTWFFVQNEESEKLLQSLGFQNISVSGDTRFDRVIEIAQNVKSFPLVEKFAAGKFVAIIGSSWKADEEILFEYINDKLIDIRWIIAPHEIHESNVQRIMNSLTRKVVRYSMASDSNISEKDVLIIDNIGMLSSIYQYGKLAWIGGGFGSGIHNILEAATFGLPVVFGPNHLKFQEAVDLIEAGGAFKVTDKKSAGKILIKLFKESDFCSVAGNICKKYIEKKKGATKMITLHLSEKMESFLKFETTN